MARTCHASADKVMERPSHVVHWVKNGKLATIHDVPVVEVHLGTGLAAGGILQVAERPQLYVH